MRIRSPSYNSESTKLMQSDQIPFKRKISVDKFQTNSQNIIRPELRGMSPQPIGLMHSYQIAPTQYHKQLLELPPDQGMNVPREKRGISTDKPSYGMMSEDLRGNSFDKN